MTISRVATQNVGKTQDSAAAVALAYTASVTLGNLIVVGCAKFDVGVSFTAGNCTQSAGTALIDTPTLDSVVQAGNIASGIWSALVTRTGTLTIQIASTAGTFFVLGMEEYASTVGWGAARLEDHKTGSATATTAVTASMTSAGAAIFFGATGYDFSGLDNAIAPGGSYVQIYREPDANTHMPGVIFDQLVTVGTSQTASSVQTNTAPYVITGAVYKEASGAASSLMGQASL